MYVEERVCTVEARKVRAMPRRQGAKPYEAHCVEEIRNKFFTPSLGFRSKKIYKGLLLLSFFY